MSGLLSTVIGALARAVRLGVTDATPATDVKRIMLVNGMTVVICVIAVMWILVGALLREPYVSAVGACHLTFFGPILLLNRAGHHLVATCWIMLVALALLVGMGGIFGPRTGAQYMILSGVAFALVVFPHENRRLAWGMAALAMAAFVLLTEVLFKTEPLLPLVDHWLMNIARISAVLAVFAAFGWWSQRSTATAELLLEHEKERSDGLLLNILPESIADRLKADEDTIADGHEQATVLFSDLVGFTPLSASVSPRELVAILDDIFRTFDTLCDRHGLEKIKTIGDAYMAAAGLPAPRPDHADAVAAFALDMCAAMDDLESRHSRGLSVRVGMHSGPIVAASSATESSPTTCGATP